MSNKLKKFFQEFELASNNFDYVKSGAFFSPSFLHGDPEKVQTINRDDFVKALPLRKAFFEKLGLKSSMIEITQQIDINSVYTLVKTKVLMQFDNHGVIKDIVQTASYIVKKDNLNMAIVVYINDQLLNSILSEHDLI